MSINQDHEQGEVVPASEITCLGANLMEKLTFINTHKIAGSRPVHVACSSSGGSATQSQSGLRPATASSTTSNASTQPHWVQPSGPRRPGEGTENEEQGIISAEQQPGGGVVLRITLLAAGFVIGPAGSSVREIMRVTGVDIKSWTDSSSKSRHGTRRPCRVFVVEGDDEAVGQAVDIVSAAVDRYKDLCEGRFQGQSVPRQQRVMNVEFSYQPPPRNVVPFAAALKGNITRPPLKTTPDFGTRTGPGSLLPLLPGYLLPMAGPYLPGSPQTNLPFPMYTQSRGSGYDLPDVPCANAADSSYSSGFDMNQLLGTSAQTTWSMPSNNMGSGFAYPSVDPASMMAYMSLMMPPPSPAGAFAAMDPSTGLGMGTIPAFQGSNTLHHMSPPAQVPGNAPAGFTLAHMGPLIGSPPQAMYGQHPVNMDKLGGHQGDLSGFGAAKPMAANNPHASGNVRMDFSDPSGGGYHMQGATHGMGGATMPTMATAPMGTMMPNPYGGSFTAGTLCWFPPSPMAAVSYAPSGWKNMPPASPGRSAVFQQSAPLHSSPSNSISSPSRLNPMAQPWSSLDGGPPPRGPPSTTTHSTAPPPHAQHPTHADPQYPPTHAPHHHDAAPQQAPPPPPMTPSSSSVSKGSAVQSGQPTPVTTTTITNNNPTTNGQHAPHTLTRQPTAEAPSGAAHITTTANPQDASPTQPTTKPSNTPAATSPAAPHQLQPTEFPQHPPSDTPKGIAHPHNASTNHSPDTNTNNNNTTHTAARALANPPTPLKIDDTLPTTAPLSVGKTPKRPSASHSTGYQTCTSSMSSKYSPGSSTGGAGTRSTGQRSAGGLIRSLGSSNGQGMTGGAGVGVGASPSRPMVSSEDPLISPSRFTRGNAGAGGPLRNKPRAQAALGPDLNGTNTREMSATKASGPQMQGPTSAAPAAVLTSLPGLVEAMNTNVTVPAGPTRSAGGSGGAGAGREYGAVPTAQEV